MRKNKILNLVTVLALTVLLIVGLTMCNSAGTSERREATLVVNGATVKDAQAYLHAEYPIIPLIKTFSACGYEVIWTASDVAVVTIDSVAYTVSLSDCTMIAEGETQDLLVVPPGTNFSVCEISEKDILIYCHRLRSNLHTFTDIQFEYSADTLNSVIYVDIGVLAEMSE